MRNEELTHRRGLDSGGARAFSHPDARAALAAARAAVDHARMVRLDRIYTRGGDDGSTSLGDGQRVPKHHLRVEAPARAITR